MLAGLVLLPGMAAAARPPYVALALLPVALTRVPLLWRIVAAGTIVLLVAAWSAIVTATVWTRFGAVVGAHPLAQLAQLRDHPVLAAQVAWSTFAQYGNEYLAGFVGFLGWRDTKLPAVYYTISENWRCGRNDHDWAETGTDECRKRRGDCGGLVTFSHWRVRDPVSELDGAAPCHRRRGARSVFPSPCHGRRGPGARAGKLAYRTPPPSPVSGNSSLVVSLAVVLRAVVMRYYLG